jgi:hypothetical protein
MKAPPKIRHQLFLTAALTERLEQLAAKPGVTKSEILAQAVEAWLNRRGTSELEDRFGARLDRISMALGRIERDCHIQLESLALFIHYELGIHPPLADDDKAGRTLARLRFNAFVEQVAHQIAGGRRTIAVPGPNPFGTPKR